MWHGPQPQNHAARLQVVDRIVADLHRTYGDVIQAIALYGSLSRGTDGDFSDVELWCVLDTPGLDQCEEWVYGASKAEVDLYGADVMAARVGAVSHMWPLQQGEIINCRPLFGDRAYFLDLRERVMSPPKPVFDAVIAEMVVGEFYEWMGKLRNGVARNDLDFLPIITCDFARHMALLAALVHRHVYRTSDSLLREALALPTLPSGYTELAHLVLVGNLQDKAQVIDALEVTWAGIGPWLAYHEIDVTARAAWPWA